MAVTSNFALNPSFEGVAGSFEVARNYHVNPGAVASTSGFAFYDGAGGNTASMSLVNAEWSLSGSAARVTWASVVNSEGDINAVVGPIAGVGTVTTVVFRWVASRSGMVIGAPEAYDENVGYIATTARSRSSNLTAMAGEVVEDWVTFAIPQGATADLQLFVDVIGKQAGDFVEMSMADAHLGVYQPDRQWFSDAYSPDSDLMPSLSGTASVLRAIGVSGLAASDASRGWNIASSQWASSGVRSVRNYRPAPGVADSFIRIPTNWFPGFAPGKVYGVKAKVRLAAPLSGATVGPNQQPTRLRRFMAVFGGVGELGSPDQYPNEPGVHEIQWIFTVPESATGLTAFRVYSGHSFGDHWVDDVLVVTADTEAEAQAMLAGPFWWGDSPTETRPDGYTRRSWWEGTPNNSVSVRGEWEPGVLSGWIAAHTGMPSLRVTVPGPVYAGDRLLVNTSRLPALISDPLAPLGVPTVYRQGEHEVTLVRPDTGFHMVTDRDGRTGVRIVLLGDDATEQGTGVSLFEPDTGHGEKPQLQPSAPRRPG